ncbi:restriction endonuclease subunit S [Vibrio vulnificus]|nr:restriction endonuclease subunit S [Vibrio vulnificus]
MSWPMVSFLSVCDFQGGTQPPKSTFIDTAQDGYIRLLQIQDFKRSDKKVFIPLKKTLKTCQEDDILIARYGASIGKILTGLSGAYNVALTKTIPDLSVLDKKYLYYFLVSEKFQGFLKSVGTRAAQAGFNKDDFANLQIPLPPLETQKQIAAVLEKADQLRKDCQQMEQELNSLAQSVFIDMFGDPVTNPKGWEVRVLSNVVETIQGGKSPKCESRPALNNEWGILKLSAVTGGLYRPDQNKAILEGTLPNPDIELKQGDLLFTRKNTYELVGACAYVRETPEQLMLPDLIFRFQMPEQLKVYLWGLLNNQSFNLKVRALASGAAGSMPNIAKSKLYDLTLPLPPESEIEKYTRSIVGIWEQQDTLKELRGSYQANFNALMQKAFKGELNL